jgi:multidrug resistance efflux pump
MTTPPATIPTSPAQRWRLWRRTAVPLLILALSIALAALVWRRWVAPPTFVAEAEAVHGEVRALRAGWLTDWRVDVLQPVQAGALLGRVITTDPDVLEASLAVVRAEVEFMLASLHPVSQQERIALDRERLQLEWMKQRVELASLQVRLPQAEAELARSTALHAQKLVSDQSLEQTRAIRDALSGQLQEQTRLVAALDPARRSHEEKDAALPTRHATLRAAIKVQEEKLRLTEAQLKPVELRAPIDGVAAAVLRRNGEMVASGEVLLRLAATQPRRLVGYLRQPLPFEPRAGMPVKLRTRDAHPRAATGEITAVGAELEPIPATVLNAMHLPAAGELALRVHVSTGGGLALRPGEQVDAIVVTP